MRQVTIIDGETVFAVCRHEWVWVGSKPSDSDTFIDEYKCRYCPEYKVEEILGSEARAIEPWR